MEISLRWQHTEMTTNANLLDLDDGDNSPHPALEILVLTISECFVYKIPPLRSASGHRAEEWDLANPLFTGCIRVYQADVKLRIVIYGFKDPKRQVVNDEDIVFFGECPIEIKPNDSVTLYVDGVIDSSRYYVLRIKDPKSTRTTNIGIGFREKEQGFDFKNCLNEYIRYVDRSQLADKLSKLSTSANHHDNNGGLLGDQEEFEDFIIHDQKKAEIPNHLADHISPLKEGEKIKVKLNIKSRKHDESEEGESSHSNHSTDLLKPLSSKGGLNLKPPPPPGATVSTSTSSSSTNDDEWGDFSSGV